MQRKRGWRGDQAINLQLLSKTARGPHRKGKYRGGLREQVAPNFKFSAQSWLGRYKYTLTLQTKGCKKTFKGIFHKKEPYLANFPCNIVRKSYLSCYLTVLITKTERKKETYFHECFCVCAFFLQKYTMLIDHKQSDNN